MPVIWWILTAGDFEMAINARRIWWTIFLVMLTISCIDQSESLYCTSVEDGDTFQLNTGETARLVGIDAPELFEPGGDISQDFLASLIRGKEVVLVSGEKERDAYDRLLRYVYVDDICVNEEMVRKGYAEVRYFSPDDPYLTYYIGLEMEAEQSNAGLWAYNLFQSRTRVHWENPPVITAEDAVDHYGEYVIIEGVIETTYNSGTACFLNFHTDTGQFTAVIFACDFSAFPGPPEIYYLKKKVYIAGMVKQYEGNPEIIVKIPEQIRILE
jgi:endonuclease YncB( thermonuclease family)